MKILAIDSSGMVASVAYLVDDVLVAEYTTNFKLTHSQTLLPMLEEVKNRIELNLDQIDAIAIAAGPGSFTGLRIGSATAKGLGLALNKPLISVSTLEAMAYNIWAEGVYICPMIDARREEVFVGVYEQIAGKLNTIIEPTALPIRDLLNQMNETKKKIIFLGDGSIVYKHIIDEIMQENASYAPAHLLEQRAGSIAVLGANYYRQGIFEKPEEHQPVYLRLSQAERELMEKRGLNQ